jgi:site-specific recombinase
MRAFSSDPVDSLANLPPEAAAQTEREWLQDTLAWLKAVPPASRTERLCRLAEGICEQAATKERFQQIWLKAFAPRLFSEAGLPEATSLPRELIARIKSRLLPQSEDKLDLYAALQMADVDDEDTQWVSSLSAEDIAPWRELLGGTVCDFSTAIRLLALRAAAIGLSRGIMKIMPYEYETESPCFGLTDEADRFARSAATPDDCNRLHEVVLKCRLSAGLSHTRMEELGVSSDLVFRLDLMIAQLERIEVLLRIISGQKDGRLLASMLVRAFADERSLRSLVRRSVNRVAREIVAHTGKSGEHYIAGSWSDWARMGYGAVGAGGITAFTALFKYMFASMALAPLWIGVAHSLNYTISFVLMQFLGWRLASKMPSMTAAALCDALEKDDGMHSEVELVAAITRTQTVVTFGNLMGAIPLAVLIDLLIQWKTGYPFLSTEAAMHGLESMDPLRSLTIAFAALTGCFLWLSSLVAGWTANWMVLNNFPEAISQSRRIRASIGIEQAMKLSKFVKRHFSGVAGYTCLGLLLGLLPFVSVFVGVPVEVRHITLASASLAYDVSSLAWSGPLPWPAMCWAGLGLLATGVLNFSVSFTLGLWLALNARNLDTKSRRKLLAELWNEFRHHPTRFLWNHDLPSAAPRPEET